MMYMVIAMPSKRRLEVSRAIFVIVTAAVSLQMESIRTIQLFVLDSPISFVIRDKQSAMFSNEPPRTNSERPVCSVDRMKGDLEDRI